MPNRLTPIALALLLCALPAAAGEPVHDDAALQLEFKPKEEISVQEILGEWGRKFGAQVVTDPQIAGVKVTFLNQVDAPVTWGGTKQLLDFHDVVVVESKPSAEGVWLIRAHHRRNLAQKETPPWRLVRGDALPAHEELITAVFQIQHGAGNSIFATVRGLLTRDTNRIGNILYVQGPEVVIVVDLASKVRYYAEVIASLDVPGPARTLRPFVLKHADPQEMAALIASIVSSQVPDGRPEPQVVADRRTRRVAVLGTAAELTLAEQTVAAFDVPSVQGPAPAPAPAQDGDK